MNRDLFNIGRWHQNDENGNTHETRFYQELNNLFEGVESSISVSEEGFQMEEINISFPNKIRISRLPSIEIDPLNGEQYFKGKEGVKALFISLLANWDKDDVEEEDLGARYLGTSLVFFPCYKQITERRGRRIIYRNELLPSGIIVALGMGTGGPGPDENLVSNPGHMRRFEGMIATIKENINRSESLLWFRKDPIKHKPIPKSLIEDVERLFQAKAHALYWREENKGGYGQYLYAVAALKFNDENGRLSENQKEILRGFIKFYARERGLTKNTNNDLSKEWYNKLFNTEITDNIDSIREELETHKYLVLVGPPGTKKTDILNQIANDNINFSTTVKIQFHSNTTYQNFVGGIQPKLSENDNNVSFEFFKGPLIKAIENAINDEEQKHLLIIDEINRADLANVLGEAINLFEPTQNYSVNIPNYGDIKIPDNLYVLCAMNSADRNISSIDVAIRRRFAFINIWPKEPTGNNSCSYGRNKFNELRDLFLEYGDENDLQLMPGGFYFLGNNEEEVKGNIKIRLIPLLEDYLYENRISILLLKEIELFLQNLKLEM